MRCLGITKQLKRCQQQATGWWPYCHVHRRQVAYIMLTIIGGITASYLATLLPEWRKHPDTLIIRRETVIEKHRETVIEKPERKKQTQQPQKVADVVFVAGRPSNPFFWLFNQGQFPAERPKYMFVLYDLDEGDTEQPRKILYIPVKLLEDYIRPSSGLGPWRILDLSDRARQVPQNHRVFGYVMVECFNCESTRYYWVFFENGHSGWTREVSNDEARLLNKTLASVIYARESAVSMVDKIIPISGRKLLQ
jgi:hypothetical protein